MMDEITSFFKGIFQDVDQNYSAKRAGFFVFVLLVVVCTVASLFKLLVPAMVWAGLVDLTKWIGAAILGERAPAALAALKTGVTTVAPILPDATQTLLNGGAPPGTTGQQPPPPPPPGQ